MNEAKIFGIGFHKTATTSLAQALSKLGYRVCGPFGIKDRNIQTKVYEIAFAKVEEYDAFQDNPWPIIYKELDQKYPGSKFILTTRPTDKWIKSAIKYFGSKNTPMRKWIYGVGNPKGNEDIYIERYERHNREVQEYFQNRPDDLLVISLTEGEGWEKLCPFLGKEIPEFSFPHANKIKDRNKLRIIQLQTDIMKAWRSLSSSLSK